MLLHKADFLLQIIAPESGNEMDLNNWNSIKNKSE